MKITLADFTLGFGVVTTIAQGIAGGTVHLTDVVPMEWIPKVTAWMGLIAFVNVAILTALAKMSATTNKP